MSFAGIKEAKKRGGIAAARSLWREEKEILL